MAVIPVFIDASFETRLKHTSLKDGDLLILRMPEGASQSETESSVAAVGRALDAGGVTGQVVVILATNGWSVEHMSDEQLRQHGLRKL